MISLGRRHWLVIATVLAVPSPAAALPPDYPPSLMFNSTEVEQINRAIAIVQHGAGGTTMEDLHLDAMLYYGPDRWTAWINGQRFTPASQTTHFTIVGAGEKYVEFTVSEDARPVRLYVNQVYRSSSGDTAEGREP